MNAAPLASVEPFLQPWSGTAVTNLTGTPSLVTVTVSGPGASGFSAAQTKPAVQELAWTAGRSRPRGCSGEVRPRQRPTDAVRDLPHRPGVQQPSTNLQYQGLAPIWITAPVRNQVFPAGALAYPSHATVVATGQSCAFEGTTGWQLKLNGTVVRSGAATASSGCPTRGTWQVGLGALTAGNYTIREVRGEPAERPGRRRDVKPFTVR